MNQAEFAAAAETAFAVFKARFPAEVTNDDRPMFLIAFTEGAGYMFEKLKEVV